MPVEIIYPADRDAWLRARQQDITASIAGALLGVHPYTTAYAIWASKMGRVEIEDFDGPALRRGRLLEPVVAEMLREDRPDWTVDYPLGNRYYHDVEARLGATPDSFATRPDIFGVGSVQFKTASDYAFNDWLDPDTGDVTLPLWIAVQTLIEAELTGANWTAVALMVVGRGIELHVIDVPIHAKLIRRIREKVTEFWAMADAGEHPPVDWLRDGPTVLDVYRDTMPERRDLTGDAVLDEEVSRYMRAKAAEREASAIADAIRPRIIHALGNAEAGETVNWQFSARAQHRDSYIVKPSSMRVLRVKPRENLSGSF